MWNNAEASGGGATIFNVQTSALSDIKTVEATAAEVFTAFMAGPVIFALSDASSSGLLINIVNDETANVMRFQTLPETYVASSPNENPHTISLG